MENNNAVPEEIPVARAVQPKKKFSWKGLWEFLRFAVVVVVIVILIRVFIAQPFIVDGTSMVPNFQTSNYLIVDEISYRFHEPQRGDVIIFHPPIAMQEYYIKRIIGMPGDTVSVKDSVVTITNADHPNGIVLSEPYITPDTLNENITVTVPAGEYFVMGDNRPVSYDSRSWGLLPRQNITGRAFLRLYPFNEISVFPGKENLSAIN